MRSEILSTSRPSKPIDQMTPDELCKEAIRLRELISRVAEQLGGIYGTLYSSVRRRTANADLSAGEIYAYTSVSNAGKRLAGTVLQAVRRTSNIDRLVDNAKADAEESERQRSRKEQDRERSRATKQAVERRDRDFRERLLGYDSRVTQDDLIRLYGEG